jgi:hypothetical protein
LAVVVSSLVKWAGTIKFPEYFFFWGGGFKLGVGGIENQRGRGWESWNLIGYACLIWYIDINRRHQRMILQEHYRCAYHIMIAYCTKNLRGEILHIWSPWWEDNTYRFCMSRLNLIVHAVWFMRLCISKNKNSLLKYTMAAVYISTARSFHMYMHIAVFNVARGFTYENIFFRKPTWKFDRFILTMYVLLCENCFSKNNTVF